jgi:chromosome partitioning protein
MIYTLAHTKGGSKKSTTAWHLANGLRQNKYSKGKKIVIVDVDTQQTITIVNDIRASKSKLKAFTVLQPQTIAELLEIFEVHSDDIIICDTGGFDKDINRVAISRADKLIVPLMATIHDILGLTMFQSIISEIDEAIKINVLLVGVHHKQTNFKSIEEIISDNPNAKLLSSKILSKNSNFKTMENGLSVYDIKDDICKRYDGVIDELKRY